MVDRNTTIHDLARMLQISASTVSRALNDHPAISAVTRERVREAAKACNYRHNRLASSLRLGRSKIIGVIIPSARISFFGSVVHGIENIARKKGYSVLLFQSNEKQDFEEQGIETLLQSNVDGILASVAMETRNYAHFEEVKKQHIPLIFFDRSVDHLNVPAVVIDDYKGSYMATNHLIIQGYQRIAYIGGPQHIEIFDKRLLGYLDAMKDHGRPVDNDLVAFGEISTDSGRIIATRMLENKQAPDAFATVEDFTALGVLQTVRQLSGYRPGSTGVIGFANEAFSEFLTPSLSTVDQQTNLMGEQAANLFFSGHQHPEQVNTNNQKIILEPRMIIRESSINPEKQS
ncbi:transcriptional regulator, LacI family [bacterium A37T11]|nr:transcriptional regulator, LacI family [bacterium A37T11]